MVHTTQIQRRFCVLDGRCTRSLHSSVRSTAATDGQDTNLDTLEKVAEYLQVNPADLINVKSKVEAEALSAQIAALCEAEPRLAKVFQEAIYRLDQDEISPEAMRDIVRYAAYRFDMEAEDKELAGKYETTSP